MFFRLGLLACVVNFGRQEAGGDRCNLEFSSLRLEICFFMVDRLGREILWGRDGLPGDGDGKRVVALVKLGGLKVEGFASGSVLIVCELV